MMTWTTKSHSAALLEQRAVEAGLVIQGLQAELAEMLAAHRAAAGAEAASAAIDPAQDALSTAGIGELLFRVNANAGERLSLIRQLAADPLTTSADHHRVINRLNGLRDDVTGLKTLREVGEG